MKQVHFEIDRNAFEGPFRCHSKMTELVEKTANIADINFRYSVWQCKRCKEEYIDITQSAKLELIWMLEKLLKKDRKGLKRSLNYDGKMFFLRFPKELTRHWGKENYADITVLDANRFIVEIR